VQLNKKIYSEKKNNHVLASMRVEIMSVKI